MLGGVAGSFSGMKYQLHITFKGVHHSWKEGHFGLWAAVGGFLVLCFMPSGTRGLWGFFEPGTHLPGELK